MQEGQEDSLRAMTLALSSSSQLGLATLRSVETPACASNTINTFRHAQDEIIAIFPPGDPAEAELGGMKVLLVGIVNVHRIIVQLNSQYYFSYL
jgi:hypothetical protein